MSFAHSVSWSVRLYLLLLFINKYPLVSSTAQCAQAVHVFFKRHRECSETCVVKVTREVIHHQLCGPHIVTQVSFYRLYTCVLVGGSKYVHSTQHSASLPQKPQETPSPPVVQFFPSASITYSLTTSEYISHPPIFMCIHQHFHKQRDFSCFALHTTLPLLFRTSMTSAARWVVRF